MTLRLMTFIGLLTGAIVGLGLARLVGAEPTIYWGSAATFTLTNTIQRANVDGSGVENVVSNLPSMPRYIAVDGAGGKIYWIKSDFSATTIQRANLDGTGVEDLVATGNTVPRGLAVDGAGGKMYWSDGTVTIRRANLDGSGVEDLVTGFAVSDIALDVTGGKMYWAKSDISRGPSGLSKIQRANLDGSSVEDLVTTAPGHFVRLAVDGAGGKIYWIKSDFSANTIQRANLDGTGVEDLVTTELVGPFGLAVDGAGGKIYWFIPTSQELGTIQRANLDGSGVEELLIRATLSFGGLALDLTGATGNGDTLITWAVTGVDVELVVCKNKTTGQKGRIDVGVPTSGSCGDLGLVWDAGDNIQVKAVGTVVSVADAGGSVTGIAANLLVCKNRSSDPQEKVRVDNPVSPWNCSDEGLPLAVGERLQWKAKGLAN